MFFWVIMEHFLVKLMVIGKYVRMQRGPYGVRREWPSVVKTPQRLRESQTGDNTTRGVFLME